MTKRTIHLLFIFVFLLGFLPAGPSSAAALQAPAITIDGSKEADWGAALASDPLGDMSEPNLDLQGMYLIEDSDNFYFGFDAFASNWGMTYGIYIDTDQVDGSGANSDPWGRSVRAISKYLPEHTLYVYHDSDFLQDVQLNHWTGSGWTYDSLVSQGGAQAYGAANDWVEYRVPKAALGNPTRIAVELFTTGGDGHAQDSVPSDPNVAFAAPDWDYSLITTLSAFVTFPQPKWFLRGDFNGWSTDTPLYDDGLNGDAAAGDGVYTAQLALNAGRYEYKVALADWSVSYPGSGNSWVIAAVTGDVITFTFDTRTFSDGWLPAENSLGVSADPGTWTAVGDWQGWNNANPDTAMSALGGGLYELTTIIPAPGTYQYKAVKTGSWDAIGADSRSNNAATALFTTEVTDQTVYFRLNALSGRVNVFVQPPPPMPRIDNDIWWDGVRHDSRDLLYRTPGGAAPAGTPVLIRLRTYHNDVTSVRLRIYDLNANAQRFIEMVPAAVDVPCYQESLAFTCDFWEATVLEATPNNLWYRFVVTDGSDTDYYADDTYALDGGLGRMTEEIEDISYALMFYDPAFTAPDWVDGASMYQIFPDRFRNGRANNDPQTGDVRYDDPVLKLDWGILPEGYCRNYADGATNCPWRFDATPPDWSPTKEGPRGRDYYGGDLKGVDQYLDYLQSLGVNVLYFNPLFDSASNHGYDTQDYYAIDPYFGTQKDWENLVKHADQRGMRIILDGVFNHLSSDSMFFDRYHHYPTLGACESLDSPYRSWFYFRDVAVGTGTCVDSQGRENSALYDGWFGFDSIPVINKSLPEVQAYFLTSPDSVSRYWLNQGAAGWRLDVMGDSSFPNGYWETFRSVVKEEDADALIIGELWQKDSTLLRFLRGDRADTTMNYRTRDAILGLLAPQAFDSKGFADSGYMISPSQFAARLESIREDYPDAAYYSLMNLMGSHDTERVLWTLTPGAETTAEKELNAANLAEGKQRQKLASLIQFTMPGIPTVFYGDEVAMTGDDDPDDRRTFPWLDRGGDPDLSMFLHYKVLNLLRKANDALVNGDFQILLADDASQVVAYGRKTDSRAAIVIINRGDQPQTGAIPVAGYLPEGTFLYQAYAVGSGGPRLLKVVNGEIAGDLGPLSAVVLLTGKMDLKPPAAPEGLIVTGEGDGSVSLAWSSVSGAAGYNLYRSPLSGGGWVKVNSAPIFGLDYTDTGLRNAVKTYYVVTALDSKGNESPFSNEVSGLPRLVIGWANIQWPPSIDHTISAVNRTPDVYGQVWIDGATNQPGVTPSLRAQLGYGPEGSDPAGNSDWTWVEAVFNTDAGNNDEFKASLLPEMVGAFDYAYRYTTTNGLDWVYADLDGIGNGYSPAQAGSLVVNPSGDSTPPAAPANLHVLSASPAGVDLAWDAVTGDATLYGYEILRSLTPGGPYEFLARVSGATSYVDTAVTEGGQYFYVVRSLDLSFNRSGYSNEVSAIAQLRSVTLVITVTTPATTPAGMSVYIAGTLDRLDGGLPQWNPSGVVLTNLGSNQWQITLTGKEATQIEYKYTLGSWDYVEKGAACDEIANRTLTLSYGVNGVMNVNDTVQNWRNVSPCGN